MSQMEISHSCGLCDQTQQVEVDVLVQKEGLTWQIGHRNSLETGQGSAITGYASNGSCTICMGQ